jgi:TIR domain
VPGTIFISHRTEYGSLVRELKKAIKTTSRGQIDVVISEDLSGAEEWRAAIKSNLKDAKYLFLVYGAPYEDWSWCFYEAGYFAGTHPGAQQQRSIYCIARPKVDPPGPLSDLQMVTDKERLIAGLSDIYDRTNVEYEPAKLRDSINQAAKGLFGKLEEFVSYPRVYFIAKDADFDAHPDLPSGAVLKGDATMLTRLFGIGRDEVPWSEIVQSAVDRTEQELFFYSKWLEETKRIILAARQNRFIPPQTVLVRGGQRVRFLLYVARTQGDGLYCCEFLVIDEVGGPALGLSQQQLALLTSVRMGFRFRFELIKRFAIPATGLSDEQRRSWIRDVPRIIDSMLTESDARGNITLEDLQGAFEEYEADRIATIVGYWPVLKENLYGALGLSPDGKAVSDQGLIEGNLERYRLAFDALRLINIEFLSRCCARLSRMMTRPEDELKQNAELIDLKMVALDRLKARPVARLDPRAASEPDKLDFHPLATDQVSLENRPSV